MALALALGSIASSIFGGAISAISASRSASNQMAYNSALNRESYEYSRKLNEQMYNLNYWQNKHNLENDISLTNYNYGLQRESRQTSFQDTRKDLESAGYNPLLALGVQSNGLSPGMNASTSGQGSASFSSADSDALFNAMNSATSAYNNTRQIDELVKQTDSNIKSSAYTNDVNLALAEMYRSQTRGQDINNTIQNTYGLETAHEQLNNLRKDGLIKTSQQREIEQNIVESMARTSSHSANADYTKQLTKNAEQEYDINEPTRRFAKDHPTFHGFLQRINPASAIGSLAGLKFLTGGARGPMTINNYH